MQADEGVGQGAGKSGGSIGLEEDGAGGDEVDGEEERVGGGGAAAAGGARGWAGGCSAICV